MNLGNYRSAVRKGKRCSRGRVTYLDEGRILSRCTDVEILGIMGVFKGFGWMNGSFSGFSEFRGCSGSRYGVPKKRVQNIHG